MRRALWSALLLTACSGERAARAPADQRTSGDPDAILVRLPHATGPATAYRWGTDSVIWESGTNAPTVQRVLAFDADQGSLAFIDSRGAPGRLDLRLRSAEPAATVSLTSAASADGWAIFGLTAKRDVSRLTPSGNWSFHPERTPDVLIPVVDGTLILMSAEGGRTRLTRMRPPEVRVLDTGSVPHAEMVVNTEIGDRVYFLGDSGLSGVRVRDLTRTRTVPLPEHALDAVATPSGDRVFVALRGRKSVVVVDRYAEEIDKTIALDAPATALRMDPDGQFVLAREAAGDTVTVIAVATSQVVARVVSSWRSDLPLVGPDGRIALAQGNDVILVDRDSHREHTRFRNGAADLWTLIRWNGFRPRARGLDEPVNFAADSDSTGGVMAADSSTVAVLPPPAGVEPARPATPDAVNQAAGARDRRPSAAQTFTVSFAALLAEERAYQMARSIRVDGKTAHVVLSARDGAQVYRVVLGPFESREDADRAGRRSGLPYWIFEGAP